MKTIFAILIGQGSVGIMGSIFTLFASIAIVVMWSSYRNTIFKTRLIKYFTFFFFSLNTILLLIMGFIGADLLLISLGIPAK